MDSESRWIQGGFKRVGGFCKPGYPGLQNIQESRWIKTLATLSPVAMNLRVDSLQNLPSLFLIPVMSSCFLHQGYNMAVPQGLHLNLVCMYIITQADCVLEKTL